MLNQNVVCAILSLTLAITRVRENKSRNDRRQCFSDLSFVINYFNSVFADINFLTNTRYNIKILNITILSIHSIHGGFIQFLFLCFVSSAVAKFLSNKNIRFSLSRRHRKQYLERRVWKDGDATDALILKFASKDLAYLTNRIPSVLYECS